MTKRLWSYFHFVTVKKTRKYLRINLTKAAKNLYNGSLKVLENGYIYVIYLLPTKPKKHIKVQRQSMKDHRRLFKVGEPSHLYVLSDLVSGSFLLPNHELNKHFL